MYVAFLWCSGKCSILIRFFRKFTFYLTLQHQPYSKAAKSSILHSKISPSMAAKLLKILALIYRFKITKDLCISLNGFYVPKLIFEAQQTEAKTERIRLIDNEHNFIKFGRTYTKIGKKRLIVNYI